jgi:hypothetical protein
LSGLSALHEHFTPGHFCFPTLFQSLLCDKHFQPLLDIAKIRVFEIGDVFLLAILYQILFCKDNISVADRTQVRYPIADVHDDVIVSGEGKHVISFAVATEMAFRIRIRECNSEFDHTIVIQKLEVIGKKIAISKMVLVQDSLNVEIKTVAYDNEWNIVPGAEILELGKMSIDNKLINKCAELFGRNVGNQVGLGKQTLTRSDRAIQVLASDLIRSLAYKAGEQLSPHILHRNRSIKIAKYSQSVQDFSTFSPNRTETSLETPSSSIVTP